VYLGALAWLLSPLWRPADGPPSDHAQVSPGVAARAIGISPLARLKPLPERLPGSSTVTAGAAEAGNTEPVSEVGPETTATLPEGAESSATPTPEVEPSEPSQEETIIGFEG
jgi:hypothetical protein